MTPRQLVRDWSLRGFASRHRAGLGLLAGVAVLVAIVVYVVGQQQQNKRAIRVGCVLLGNAIVQGTNDQAAPLLVGEIVRLAVEHHHRVFVVKFREVSSHPPRLHPPDCQRVANDPDSVVAIPARLPMPPAPLEYGGHG